MAVFHGHKNVGRPPEGLPILQGTLLKQSPDGLFGYHAWQERFVQLFASTLLYKKSADDPDYQAAGQIPLRSIIGFKVPRGGEADADHLGRFELETDFPRVFVFDGGDEDNVRS